MLRLVHPRTAVLLLISTFLAAPSSQAAPAERYVAGHYVAASPRPELRPAREAARLARQVAAAHPGAFVVRGRGESMQPLYPSGTLLVVQPRPYETLQRGMTVMFRNSANHSITHVLVARTPDGWRTSGLNNRRADYLCVNATNIAGVVVAAFKESDPRSIALR